MTDGVSAGVVLKWVASKVAGKAFGATWDLVLQSLRRVNLASLIDEKFRLDRDAKNICDGVPTVRRDLLSDEHVLKLFERCIEDDSALLGKYLLDRQLIQLSLATRNNSRIQQVRETLGRVVRDSLQSILTKDDSLLAQFAFVARKGNAREHQEILDVLLQVRADVSALTASVSPVERRSNLTGEESLSVATTEQINYLFEENIRLSNREREFLDEQFQNWWDEIHDELAVRNHASAIEKGQCLESWLKSAGIRVTPILRSKAHVILAHLAVIEATQDDDASDIDVSGAQLHLSKAKDELIKSDPEHEARVIALDAKLTYLTGKTDEAVRMLGGSSQPACVSIKLAILLDQSEYSDAADIASSEELHEKWVETAVTAFVRAGRDDEARDALDWAKENTTTKIADQCRVAYAHSILMRHRIGLQRGVLSIIDATNEVRTAMESAIAELTPVVSRPLLTGRLSNELQVGAIGFACIALHILGKKQECRQHATVLARHRPIPLAYGHAVLRGDVRPDGVVPEQFRVDHPGSFEAQFLATLIELSQTGVSTDRVFDQAKRTLRLAKTDNDRDRVIGLMSDVVKQDDGERFKQIVELCDNQLPSDHRRRIFLDVESSLREEDGATARETLDEIEDRDDPEWLKYSSDTYRALGDTEKAADELLALSAIMRSVSTFYQAAMAADEVGRIDTVVACLEKTVALDNTHVAAFHNLACGFGRLGQHRQAAECLRRLTELVPDEFDYMIRRAGELAIAGDLPNAINVCNELCDREPHLRDAVLQRATLLRMNRQKRLAFDSLENVHEPFWDDVEYLAIYMGLGYEVGEDAKAALAMQRILELQSDGTAKRQVLTSVSLDDLQEIMRTSQDARERTNELLIQAKCPWTFVGVAAARPVYANWRVRTQPGVNQSTLQSQAEYSTYSTNAFAVQPVGEGRRSLEKIEAPNPNQSVVIDLSASITLHELGLLDDVAQFFGNVLYPDGHSQKRLQDLAQLESGQASRRDAFECIAELCQQSRVTIESAEASQGAVLITQLSEISRVGPIFNVNDVADWLQKNGKIEAAVYQQVPRLVDLTNRYDEFARVVDAGPVLVDESAIHMLHTSGCLNALIDTVSIQITNELHGHIRQELRSFAFECETADRHVGLSAAITDNERFTAKAVIRLTSCESGEEADNQVDEVDRDWVIEAPLLALQEKVPLLADDRFCQMGVLNSQSNTGSNAFGTDHVLSRMYEEGALSVSAFADAFLKLVQWRYRFLLPHVDVLLNFAHRFAGVGKPLQEINQYMHDCMRDVGLLGGKEPTQPPTTVAAQYYLRWVTHWAEFVAQVWDCDSIATEKRKTLSEWVVSECLPCPPRNVPLSGRMILASCTDQAFLVGLLLQACHIRNLDNAKLAIDTVIAGLGIPESRVESIVSQALTRELSVLSDEKDLHVAFQQRMFLISLIRQGRIQGIRSCILANHLGMLDADQDLPEPDEELLAAIQSVGQRHRITEAGPYVFFQRQDTAGDVKGATDFVPDYVVSPARHVRESAIAFIENPEDCSLSSLSKMAIDQYKAPATSDNFETWFPAACEIRDCLESDFRLQIGALRQCLRASLTENIGEHWSKVLRPDVQQLAAIHGEGLSIEECKEVLTCVVDPNSIARTLDRYEARFGHLPLALPLSMGSVLKQWCNTTRCTTIWSDVWEWVKQQRATFRRYHACRAFAENPELIPDDKWAEFWTQSEIILDNSGRSQDGDVSTKLRGIHGYLAQHFLRHCELNSPHLANEQLLCLAHWTATQVVDVIADYGATEEQTTQLLADIGRLAGHTELMWEVARPRRDSSRSRHVVLHHPTCWSYALALSFRNASELQFGKLSGTQQQLLAQVLAAGCLRFDSAQSGSSPKIWAHDESAVEIACGVVEQLTDKQSQALLRSVVEATNSARSNQRFTESLERIVTLDSANQLFLASLLHTMSYTDKLPYQVVTGLLESTDWYLMALSQMEANAFRDVTDFFGEIQSRIRGPWDVLLPNAYIHTALSIEMADDRRSELVAFGIVAAAAGESPAILRQTDGEYSQAVEREFAHWRAQFLGAVQSAPPFVAARMRDVLASLRR